MGSMKEIWCFWNANQKNQQTSLHALPQKSSWQFKKKGSLFNSAYRLDIATLHFHINSFRCVLQGDPLLVIHK